MTSHLIRVPSQMNLSMLCRNHRLQRGINSLFVNEDCWCAASFISAHPCLWIVAMICSQVLALSGCQAHAYTIVTADLP